MDPNANNANNITNWNAYNSNTIDRTIILIRRMNRNAILVRSTPFRTWATETSIIDNVECLLRIQFSSDTFKTLVANKV